MFEFLKLVYYALRVESVNNRIRSIKFSIRPVSNWKNSSWTTFILWLFSLLYLQLLERRGLLLAVFLFYFFNSVVDKPDFWVSYREEAPPWSNCRAFSLPSFFQLSCCHALCYPGVTSVCCVCRELCWPSDRTNTANLWLAEAGQWVLLVMQCAIELNLGTQLCEPFRSGPWMSCCSALLFMHMSAYHPIITIGTVSQNWILPWEAPLKAVFF